MKMSNLLQKDFKIVENKKIYYSIPALIVLVAIIAAIIYTFLLGSPFNLGMDFTGGYTMQVKLNSKLTKDNYDDYVAQIEDIFKNLKDDKGETYGLKVSSTQLQGDLATSINVKYQAAKRDNVENMDQFMEDEVNVRLEEALQVLFKITPQLTIDGSVITATYPEVISDAIFDSIKEKVVAKYSITPTKVDSSTITMTKPAAGDANEYKEALSVSDPFSGQVVAGDTVSAVVSTELLTDAILAVVTAIVLMLIYIVFRFELSSGLAAIIALFHDIIIMFAFIVIFHIEINAGFIASLITILGYSINNTIIIFDRIRENSRMLSNKNMSNSQLANKSIKETLLRTINTSITTLIMISMVAIIAVPSIRIFALPIIFGLLAGTYSSVFIASSIWVSLKDSFSKVGQKNRKDEKAIPSSN